jgi:hypothetical protein
MKQISICNAFIHYFISLYQICCAKIIMKEDKSLKIKDEKKERPNSKEKVKDC